MKKGTQRVLTGIGIGIGLIIIGAVAAAMFIQTDRARHFVLNTINDRIPGQVRWASHDISLLGGKLALSAIEVEDPNHLTLIKADRLVVGWSWLRLVQKQIVLHSVDLENPRINLTRKTDGRLDIVSAFTTKAPPPSPNDPSPTIPELKVKALTISGGHFQYRDHTSDMTIILSDIDIKAGGNLPTRTGKLDTNIGNIQVTSPAFSMDISPLDIKGDFIKDRIEGLAVRMRRGESNVALSGQIDHLFGTPAVDLTLAGGIDLAEMKTMHASMPDATGQADIHLKAKGSIDNPNVTFSLAYGGGTLWAQQIDALTAHLGITDRKVSITETSVRLPAGQLSIAGSVDLRPVFPTGLIKPALNVGSAPDFDLAEYDLSLTLRNGILKHLPTVKEHAQGSFQSDLTLKGTGFSPDHLSCQGKLNLNGLVRLVTMPDVPINLQTLAEINFANNRLHLNRLDINTQTATLTAKGDATLSGDHINGRLSLNVPQLSDTSALSPNTRINGSARLDAKISGSLQKPAIAIELDGRGLTLDQLTFGDIGLKATLDHNRRVAVSEWVVKNQDTIIGGNGSFTLSDKQFTINRSQPINLDLTLTDVCAANFFTGKTLPGCFSGRIKLEGPPDNPTGTAHITGKDLNLPGIRPLDLVAALSLDGDILRAEPLSMKFGASLIKIEGNVSRIGTIAKNGIDDLILSLRLSGDTVQLSDILNGYKGAVDVSAQLNGPANAPSGIFRAAGRKVDLNGQILPEIALTGRLSPDKVFVDTFHIHAAPKETISGDGWYGFDQTFAFKVVSDGVGLERIDFLRGKTDLYGQAAFKITGQGTPAFPRLSGSLRLTKLSLPQLPLNDVQLEWTFKDKQLRVSGRQVDTTLTGSYHLGDGTFMADLHLNNTRMGPYFRWAEKPDLTGNVSGQFTLAGDINHPEQATLNGNVADLSIFFKQSELLRTEGVDISYKDETFFVPAFKCRLLEAGVLTLKGQGQRSGPIELTADGIIPLEAIAPFSQSLTGMKGQARISARVSGTPDDPAITATVDLSGGAFPIPQLDQSISELNGQIRLTPQSVFIEKLHGQLDTGRFSLSGEVTLDQFKPTAADLRLSATALPIEIPDTLDVLLDADVSLNGTRDASTLGGTLVLVVGTYFRDLNLSLLQGLSEITRKKREVTAPPTSFTDPFLANLAMNIDIRRRQPFRVDNDLADLNVDPDLTLTGTLNHPILTGKVNITSGMVRFEQQKFTIEKGTISFINPYQTGATIDILAKTQIRKWDVSLTASGTTAALQVRLTSEPPLVQDDIVSLLVLGKTTTELIEGEGGQSKSSTQLLADLTASVFGDDIRKATGLDLLEMETGAPLESGEAGENGDPADEDTTDRVKITIGKKLSRRLTVKYAVKSKAGELTQRTNAEYRLRERVFVSGFQDSRGIYGGQFLFRLEFR